MESSTYVPVSLTDGPILSIQHSTGSLDTSDILRVDEGQRLNLTCDVDAVPPVDPSTIEWFKDDVIVQTGPWLYSGDLHRCVSRVCR